VLERGYARIETQDGRTVMDAGAARAAGALTVRFRDQQSVDVQVEAASSDAYVRAKPKARAAPPGQPTLF
jgi:exodeoxyribonuclease VII large subunit